MLRRLLLDRDSSLSTATGIHPAQGTHGMAATGLAHHTSEPAGSDLAITAAVITAATGAGNEDFIAAGRDFSGPALSFLSLPPCHSGPRWTHFRLSQSIGR